MESETKDSLHLSHIQTDWAWIQQAHHGSSPELIRYAQERLLQRYGNAVRRYLLGALRDEHAADDLFQEFSLRFVRGDFHNASPERGRFRQFLKTVLYHLVVDYQRRKRKSPQALATEVADSTEPDAAQMEADRKFMNTWRDELLNRAWWALEQSQPRIGLPYYELLRYRADFPAVPSGDIAKEFSRRLAKPVTADAVRQTLKRARDRFADLLVNEVDHSLVNPTPHCLTEELEELGLLSYCAAALERRAEKGAKPRD